ncbi:sigma 54-interacting transcriptional regulator [Metabacillus idriensis]|uniref:HTH-type transcriptional regulatory protein TyrR n=1 Tax=Metabacillus idriensis TaxID=324768 RepID=A0A6I2MJU2_9BACI|nr:sigma 54-interacting transcriptional regulator [Metabacillus idriensis]MCM3596118.1 sigma 54-interacting transcriptional regulator [Metabacillus idriensis]MRX56093.1 PAS domain-containing protein [Metabacillus idriensis]OHR65346.1 RNA polymerase subunit sigma-54 [Bacillus sp. HMSC76G11]
MTARANWNENEQILHSLKDDILVTNLDGIIIKVSEFTGKIYGVESDSLIGKSVYDLEAQGLFTPILTPIVVKEKKKITFVQTTNKGKKLLVTGIPVYNEAGELYRVVSYSHDITELADYKNFLITMEEEMERVKTELDLLRSRQLYDAGIIAKSEAMQKVISTSIQVSEVDVNVLILGESGVGKSLLAKFIHNKSERKNGPFIEVNCGAVPDTLVEAELFGYEGGSFTGANRKGKIGLIELSDGGTLFLDEIGELPLAHQVKVLKVIQEKQFYRVGGTKPIHVDFRLISATNKDLQKAIEEKLFREDLYFRLNVVPITIPPLRQRTEDIVPLIHLLLKQFEEKYKKEKTLDEAVTHHLLHYDWKGNVRELINILERLVVISPSSLITVDHLPEYIKAAVPPSPFPIDDHQTLSEMMDAVERQILLKARKKYKTTVRMAEALGISQPSIVRKMKKHQIL